MRVHMFSVGTTASNSAVSADYAVIGINCCKKLLLFMPKMKFTPPVHLVARLISPHWQEVWSASIYYQTKQKENATKEIKASRSHAKKHVAWCFESAHRKMNILPQNSTLRADKRGVCTIWSEEVASQERFDLHRRPSEGVNPKRGEKLNEQNVWYVNIVCSEKAVKVNIIDIFYLKLCRHMGKYKPINIYRKSKKRAEPVLAWKFLPVCFS